MNHKIITIGIYTSAFLLFSGCGSDNVTSSVAKGTAFYVDSAVEGVTATCGGTTGVTGSDGSFTFEVEEECQFEVGNILLRQEGDLYENKVIIEDNIHTAQFLQTLDQDGNPDNGIKILEQTADVLSQIGLNKIPDNDAELIDVQWALENAGIDYQGRYTSAQEAQAHINKTYQEYHNQPDQPDQPQQQDQPNQPNQPNQPDQPQQPDQPNQPNQPNQPDQPQQPDQPNQPNQPQQPNHPSM